MKAKPKPKAKRMGPEPKPRDEGYIERFVEKIPDTPGCWIWMGERTRQDYGRINLRRDGVRRQVAAHRVSYEAFIGPIPEGMTLDHTCRLRCCVNPWHLKPMTLRDNLLTKNSQSWANVHASKTHCKHGHAFSPENTMMIKGRWRRCRICDVRDRRTPGWRRDDEQQGKESQA